MARTISTGTVQKILLFLAIFFFGGYVAHSQSLLSYRLKGSEDGMPLTQLLEEASKESKGRCFYINKWLDSFLVKNSYKDQPLAEALGQLFEGTEIDYLVMDSSTIVIVKDPTNQIMRKASLEKALAQKLIVEQRVMGDPKKAKVKGNVEIRGKVTDLKTGEPLANANVQVSNSKYSTSANQFGAFELILPTGSYIVNFSFVDYDASVIDLAVYASGELNVQLEKAALILDEVVIESQSTQDVKSSKIGQIELTLKEMKRAPAFLGEVDLVKQVQLLPGVTTAGEAATGFNVRGGSVDQNLVLYDGLPVFNTSHAFGFLTSFNSEAIREVSFYNGGIPAKFGGRTSSVLDIHSRDGSFEKWGGKIGVGLLTGNIMVNGPLKKDKTSIIASLRSTYSDWLLKSIRTDYADLSKSTVFFYDATLKVTHKFDSRSRISFAGYSTKDSFRLIGDSTYQWSNLQGSLKLDHKFSEKLNAEFLIGINSYGYNVINKDLLTSSDLSYRINTSSVKAGFEYFAGSGKTSFGWQLLHYQFDPGKLAPTSALSNAKPFSLDTQYAIENAFYLSKDWTFKNRFFIDVGLRVPSFFNFGAASVNVYNSSQPKSSSTIIDTLRFKSGEVIKGFVGLEPRASLRWSVNPSSSFKLGYNRIYQYLHLITNTTAVTPVDIWQPSGYHFKPQYADQLSLGYFRGFADQKYSTSVEAFYKEISNIIDFKDGAKLILNTALEADLLQGKGRSYGFETTFSKNTGRFSWSLNYTFSRSLRQVAGATPQESINGGREYAANFDQPHVVNYSWKYSLSKRIFFTGVFTYRTGRPITIPLAGFQLENTTVTYFSERNQFRIPDYHRLDFALSIEGNHRRKKIAEGTWVLSVYNVYGRQNPYTIFFENSAKGVPIPYQLSIVGTVFPSISYNLKF